MVKDLLNGLLGKAGYSKIYKSAKEGTKSFRITKAILDKLWKQCDKIKNKGVLVLTIPASKNENYILNCYLTKEKK